ncbi:hypothetical protein BROUX41_005026 [Berkeleyomyces rouxiae]|uniref:uncharacterized protein n=1 Tax=Berkeleyomyces rouxiae TaxID=2035830 RepID=UPI003B7AEF30
MLLAFHLSVRTASATARCAQASRTITRTRLHSYAPCHASRYTWAQLPVRTATRTPIVRLSALSSARLFSCIRPVQSGTAPPRADSQEALTTKHAKFLFPPRIPIYHVGTGRFTFIAVLKLTTIVMCALFCGIAVPSYVAANEDLYETLGLGLCGAIPLFAVIYITSPYVAFLHIHLPPAARLSRDTLRRYVANMPPTAQIDITTLSVIAKPRTTTIEARALRVASPPRRLGLVNFVRTPEDVARENAARKWWRFRAVGNLNISGSNRGVKEGWIWDELKNRLERVTANEQKKA